MLVEMVAVVLSVQPSLIMLMTESVVDLPPFWAKSMHIYRSQASKLDSCILFPSIKCDTL